MPTTPKNSLRYPALGDPFAPAADLQKLAEDTEAALNGVSTNIGLGAGAGSGTIRAVRVGGNLVLLYIDVTFSSNLVAGGTSGNLGTLPAALRPNVAQRQSVPIGSPGFSGTLDIATNGTLIVTNQSGATRVGVSSALVPYLLTI